jgi:hypothetical protein
MRQFQRAAILAILVSALGLYIGKSEMTLSQTKRLTFLVGLDSPTSLDPLEYDYFKHHPIQSLVNCTLTSLYRGSGSVMPELASSWVIENGGAKWKFKIRSDLTFKKSKTKVTPEIVARSFMRTIFLLKTQGTSYEFIKVLKDLNKLQKPDQKISGISVSSEEVIFEFNRPIQNLSETLSFGHFAIVSPDSFNGATGKWISGKFDEYDGCGPYFVASSDVKNLNLKKRNDYPSNLSNALGYDEISQIFEINPQSYPLLIRGSEGASLPESYKFYGSGNRSITYLRVMAHNQKESLLNDPYFRIRLRDSFYEELRKTGIKGSTSFFPKIITGIEDPIQKLADGPLIDTKKNKNQNLEISFHDSRPNSSKEMKLTYEALEAAIQGVGARAVSKKGTSIEEIVEANKAGKNVPGLDLVILLTGVSLEDPLGDVRLMFSKEGIYLPDPDGTILKELDKDEPNIQFINNKIFQSAIIWPVFHSSIGIWAHESLDMSDYNVLKPLGELQWIGRKK